MDIPKLPPDSNAPYPKMYATLFNAVTTALNMMEDGEFMKARSALIKAQQATEELYIEGNG